MKHFFYLVKLKDKSGEAVVFLFENYLWRLKPFSPEKIDNLYFQMIQWLFLVPVKGGRWHIIPQLAVYTIYIPLRKVLLWYCIS